MSPNQQNQQNKQNTGIYETQNRMSEPTEVITTKDLLYLKDAMSWELIAAKKCRHFASMATDPEIQGKLDQVGQMHQNHYDQLLKNVQSNPNQRYLQ